jgi:hypothetical protein
MTDPLLVVSVGCLDVDNSAIAGGIGDSRKLDLFVI